MAQHGFIIISDITGYTAYLSASELDHANDVLSTLLNTLLDQTKPPLVISRLEGDSIFAYSPQGAILQGQTLVEIIEATYVVFRRALDLMIVNTNCPCNACKNMPDLDLKFFVHYGTYMEQKLGNYIELVGTDVNLIHRLTKNTVVEDTGHKAYALYTQAAIDALGMAALAETMIPHTESVADIREVQMYIQPMHKVWEEKKDQDRIIVTEEDALVSVSGDFDVSPAVMWEYLTEPGKRATIFASDVTEMSNIKNDRIGSETIYVCMHGEQVVEHIIVDWSPIQCYTFKGALPGDMYYYGMYELVPLDDGVRVIFRNSKVFGGNAFSRRSMTKNVKGIAIQGAEHGMNNLRNMIAADREQGAALLQSLEEVTVTQEQLQQAVAMSLAG